MKTKFIHILLFVVIFYIYFFLLDFSIFNTAFADSLDDSINFEANNSYTEEQQNKSGNIVHKDIFIYSALRRRFYWTIFEKKRGNYASYKDYKQHWDPKTRIWKEVKEWLDEPKDSEYRINITRNLEDLHRQKRNADLARRIGFEEWKKRYRK